MNNVKKDTNENKLEFNTYGIFTEEAPDIKEIIGLIFKDYIENLTK